MNLSAQNNGLITEWSGDSETGLLTVTFYNSDKSETLGTMIIEITRLKALTQMLQSVGLHFSPETDVASAERQRTIFNGFNDTAETKWG